MLTATLVAPVQLSKKDPERVANKPAVTRSEEIPAAVSDTAACGRQPIIDQSHTSEVRKGVLRSNRSGIVATSDT